MNLIGFYALALVCGVAIGCATAWGVSEEPDPVSGTMGAVHAILHVDVQRYRHLPDLSATHISWQRLQQYVAAYPEVQLLPAEDAAQTQSRGVPDEILNIADRRSAVLRGDALSVFSIARNIQSIIPVYFHRVSVRPHAQNTIAKLHLYVLGSTASSRVPSSTGYESTHTHAHSGSNTNQEAL